MSHPVLVGLVGILILVSRLRASGPRQHHPTLAHNRLETGPHGRYLSEELDSSLERIEGGSTAPYSI